MNNKYNLIQIEKISTKLFQAGFNTDKKILTMKIEDLEKIPNLQPHEVLIIIDLKKAIKHKQIIAFLSGIKNERKN